MSKPTSNAIAFRLPKNLKREAEYRAKQKGHKNANEWCQKLVAGELVKENGEVELEKAIHLSAVNNVRQLVINCFELILTGTQKDDEFREVLSASDEEWRQITEVQKPQSLFPEYISLVNEISDEMTDPFSGEKLIVKENPLNSNSLVANVEGNTVPLAEINCGDNSPVQ